MSDPIDQQIPTSTSSAPWWRSRRATRGAGCTGLVVALFMLFYFTSLHASAGNSDGATVLLEGQSVSQGHLLLGGWRLSLDSFWTVDVVFYAIAVRLFGLHHQFLQAIPALIATFVALMAFIIGGNDRRRRGAIVGAAVIAAMLCLPSHAFALFFLQGPLHVCTTLWALIAFWLVRSEKLSWRTGLAALFFAAGLLGDFQMVALGVIPVFMAGLAAMLRRWDWRAGCNAVVASAGGVVFALIVRQLVHALGGFSMINAKPFASGSQLTANVSRLVHYAPVLLGIGSGTYGPTGVPSVLGYVHLLALLAIVGSTLVVLGRVVVGSVTSGGNGTPHDAGRYLEEVLAFGLLADMAMFVVISSVGSDAEARYLTPGLIFGAILAGRRIGAWVEGIASVRTLRAALLGSAVSGLFLAGFVCNVARPAAGQPIVQLDAFLVSHHLDHGLGGYWCASITTTESDGRIVVRPVIGGTSGTVVRYGRQSTDSWYAHQQFQFLVYTDSILVDGIDRAIGLATYGHIRERYRVSDYTVLVFDHPISVSVNNAAT